MAIARNQRARFNAVKSLSLEFRPMRTLLYRSVWLPAIITAVLLLIALCLLLATSWRSLTRLEPVQHHRLLVSRIEDAGLQLGEELVKSLSGSTEITDASLQRLRTLVAEIRTQDRPLASQTPTNLVRLQTVLNDGNASPQARAVDALSLMRRIAVDEMNGHNRLLSQIYDDSESEFWVAAGIMIVIPLLALLMLYFLRHRIFLPLKNLRSLMTLLARQDYNIVPTDNVDPMLRPLFANYNYLAGRLAQLERAREARQQSLEQEVRTATRTLLEQQRNLANAERLAAVGEVAAELAHELRNPLAGIQMSLINLRKDIDGADQASRLDMTISHIKQLTHLLNSLLSQTRQAPEIAREFRVADVVDEVLGLARYQVPAQIRLTNTIPSELSCRLPESRLRQAILNLVLNAAEALNTDPGEITVGAARDSDDLNLWVDDDGPGLPTDLIESGVRAFVSGREQGTGLGLAMVRRFARDMGGRLDMANRKPRGAHINLSLPCAESVNG